MSVFVKVNILSFVLIFFHKFYLVENYSKVSMNGRSISSSGNNAIFKVPSNYLKSIDNNFNLAPGEAVDHPSTGM